MSLVINNNLMAYGATTNLNKHYANMATSVQRLSSGLRINGAADDAAGLAIRELMRSDIATLQQGIRNANDAISLIQTADGALGVIDEKLIRMKELAEQAATGTYDTVQRGIIDDEYQAMASEITRIANATDFNGIKLLDGSLSGVHDGSQSKSTGSLKIHFGTGNASAEDYYFIDISNSTATALGVGNQVGVHSANILNTAAGESWGANGEFSGMNLLATAANAIAADGVGLTAVQVDSAYDAHILFAGNVKGTKEETLQGFFDMAEEVLGMTQAEITGTITAWADPPVDAKDVPTFTVGSLGTAGSAAKMARGDEIFGRARSASAADSNAGHSIRTQENAQKALTALDKAIIVKDKNRANMGAIQNRLENTVSNLTIQRQNMQAAESRISDVDVASEMTNFVRNQVLTQAANAMLSQANSMPQMALSLMNG